jgi:hypothetical protein
MTARTLGTLLFHYWRMTMQTVSSSPILRAVLGSFAIGAFGLLVFNFNANAQAQTGSTAEVRVVVSGPVAVRAGATCSHPEKELRPLR